MLNRRALVYLGAWLCISCGSDSPTRLEEDLSQLNRSGFPLKVGNVWEYDATVSHEDMTEAQSSYSTATAARLEIIAEDQVFDESAYRLRITHIQHSIGDTIVAHSWFAVRGDSLLGLATAGNIGGLDPLNAQLLKPVAQNDDDEPTEWGALSLVFPLATGRSWDFLPFGGLFDSDTKTVEGKERVSVPAGRYGCYHVVRRVDEPGFHLRTEQWFGPVGLVRLRSLAETLDSQGQLLARTTEAMDLVSVILK
ncbi:hypothetical protein ACFL6X_02255 [Candidatus Latescibacterota bacterium]